MPFGAASGWSWGLSIVLLVMLMRLIMVPLFVKQVKSQRKMQSHMPALQEIRKKYKNDKTRLNEETMKFYKENGINPLGGCLPLVAQLPVFWSLFNVLKAISDWKPGQAEVRAVGRDRRERANGARVRRAAVRQVPVGRHRRVVDRAGSDPGLGGGQRATTFLTMRQSAKRGMMTQQVPDPDQPGAAMAQSMSKNMMYIAPFFALTGLYWQYGLVIYWVTTNVLDAGAAAHPVPQPSHRGERYGWCVCGGRGIRGQPAVVKSTVVKGSVNAAKSNGTAKSAEQAGTRQAGTAASRGCGQAGRRGGAATAKAPTAKAPAKPAAKVGCQRHQVGWVKPAAR